MTKPELPQIRRAEWANHPNFPQQVLLLGSHSNFRQVSRVLVEAARQGESLAMIRSVYERWIAGMRSHEAYEERKLYPYLSRRWSVSFAPSEAGHQELHDADDAVRKALRTGLGVAEALEHHDNVLCAHLEVEEEQVIPLLLSLAPEEFDDYYHGRRP